MKLSCASPVPGGHLWRERRSTTILGCGEKEPEWPLDGEDVRRILVLLMQIDAKLDVLTVALLEEDDDGEEEDS